MEEREVAPQKHSENSLARQACVQIPHLSFAQLQSLPKGKMGMISCLPCSLLQGLEVTLRTKPKAGYVPKEKGKKKL